MFRRRIKRRVHHHIREFLWPSIGWRRSTKYLHERIIRMSHNTYALASGLACGAATSFCPFLGFHVPITWFLCWIFRGNLIAGVIGTFLGNPWTFPFFFWFSYVLGVNVMTLFGYAVDIDHEFPKSMFALLESGFKEFYIPTAIGGVINLFLLWPVWFIIFYPVAKIARIVRIERKLAARERRLKKLKEAERLKNDSGNRQ